MCLPKETARPWSRRLELLGCSLLALCPSWRDPDYRRTRMVVPFLLPHPGSSYCQVMDNKLDGLRLSGYNECKATSPAKERKL
jgi:hypothetical protein